MIATDLRVEDVIARRRARVVNRRGARALLVRVLFIGLIAYLLFTYGFLICQCAGQDMFPAIKDGDLCVVFRREAQSLFGERLVQNDIVAYRVNGERRFGRVAAVGGDIVLLNDGGSLIVNGVTEGGEVLFPTYAGEGSYPLRVPEGTVFLLGDYRTNTTDSRSLGTIPLADVEGKVITILRRRGL